MSKEIVIKQKDFCDLFLKSSSGDIIIKQKTGWYYNNSDQNMVIEKSKIPELIASLKEMQDEK